jgi:cobalt-zinc-cadmium efflux system outer membrane protein
MYNEILDNFDFVIQSAERQYKLGAISKKELIRLESERQTIRNETSINRIELQTIESSIKVLLNLRPEIKLIAIEESVPIGELPDLMSLYELSQKNRPDFQLSKNRIDIGTAEVKLQKAKSVPDITFSYQPKDRGSNYVRPYSGIEIGFELPLFHRNRGNIMSAEASRMRYTVESELKSNQLQNEVHASVINFMENRNNYNRFTPKYLEEVLQMNISAESNYIKRNINLLEYIDIKRIYIENYLQYLESKTRLLESASQINFVIGTQIFK